MKPPRFAYRAAQDLDEALSLLREHGGDAVVLAGGQSLIPALNFRIGAPELLVDINAITGLAGIHADNGWVRIGALTRHTQLIESSTTATHAPVLPQAARHIGHTPIRNRGTIGGSVAHADPAAELPAVLAAASGEVELTSTSDTRSVPFEEFAIGPFSTAREPDELITGVSIPMSPGTTWGCAEVTRRSGDFALAGAVAGVTLTDDHRIQAARLALFGVEPAPRRIRELEQAVEDAALTDTDLRERIHSSRPELELLTHESIERQYRYHLALTAAEMALEEAIGITTGSA